MGGGSAGLESLGASPDLARGLVASDLSVATVLRGEDRGEFALRLSRSGDPRFELRGVDGVLYARGDLDAVAGDVGFDPAPVQRVLGSLPSLAPLRAAADGGWAGLDVSFLRRGSFEREADRGASLRDLVAAVDTALERDAHVEDVGPDERGEEYRVTLPLRRLATEIQDEAVEAAGIAGPRVRKFLAAAPDRDVVVDVFVQDDELTGISLGLAQFTGRSGAGDSTLDVEVQPGVADVAAPADVAMIDPFAVMMELQRTLWSHRLSSSDGWQQKH